MPGQVGVGVCVFFFSLEAKITITNLRKLMIFWGGGISKISNLFSKKKLELVLAKKQKQIKTKQNKKKQLILPQKNKTKKKIKNQKSGSVGPIKQRNFFLSFHCLMNVLFLDISSIVKVYLIVDNLNLDF